MSSRNIRRKARRQVFARRTSPGAPPGVLIPDPSAPPTHVSVLAYDLEKHVEQKIDKLGDLKGYLEKHPVTWINVDGLGDVSLLQELAEMFKLHHLAMEDVVNVHQRAKAEPYGDHYYIVARMAWLEDRKWRSEQVSIFFGSNFVITIQEDASGDCLEPVRKRIRSGWGRSKVVNTDYLVYCLLDAIVDHYFPLVEDCGERLDELEIDLSRNAKNIMGRLFDVKRDLLVMRRMAWPLRDALNSLMRDECPLISSETRLYLRDVHDHTIQIIDLVENYRDVAAGITDVHLAVVSQRTNEVMRVLTVISTIFMPLTFIVGVYGMNFEFMPEIKWRWGYPIIWLVMLAVTILLLIFFNRKGWLGGQSRDDAIVSEEDNSN